MAAGLWFCKGLHARYGSNPHEALKNLNFARKDPEWGTQAIYSMVEIYLNPDNDTVRAPLPASLPSVGQPNSPSPAGFDIGATQKVLYTP